MALKDSTWSQVNAGLKKSVKGASFETPMRDGDGKSLEPLAAPGSLPATSKAQKERELVQQHEQTKPASRRNNSSPGNKQDDVKEGAKKSSGGNAGTGKNTPEQGTSNATSRGNVGARASMIGGLAGKQKDARGRGTGSRMNAYALLELDLDEIISPEMRAAVRKTLAMHDMLAQHEHYMKRYHAARKRQQAYVNMLILQRGCAQRPPTPSNPQLEGLDEAGNAPGLPASRSQSPTSPGKPARSAMSFMSAPSFFNTDIRLPCLPRLYGQGAPEGIPIDRHLTHSQSRRSIASGGLNLDHTASLRAGSISGNRSFKQSRSLSGKSHHSRHDDDWLDVNTLSNPLPAALVPVGLKSARRHSDDNIAPWLLLPGEDSDDDAGNSVGPSDVQDVQAYLDSLWDANAGKQQDVEQLGRIPIPEALDSFDTQSLTASEVVRAIDDKVFGDDAVVQQDPFIDSLLLPAQIMRHRNASLDAPAQESAGNAPFSAALTSYCRGKSGRSRSHGRDASCRRKRSPSPMTVANTTPNAPLSVHVLGCMAAKADGVLDHVAPLPPRAPEIPMSDAHARPESHMESTITSQVQKSLERKFQQQLQEQQASQQHQQHTRTAHDTFLPMSASYGALANIKQRLLTHSYNGLLQQQQPPNASGALGQRSAASCTGQGAVSPFAYVPKPPEMSSRQAQLAFGLPAHGRASCSMFRSARLSCGVSPLLSDRGGGGQGVLGSGRGGGVASGAPGSLPRYSADDVSGRSNKQYTSAYRVLQSLPHHHSAQEGTYVGYQQDGKSRDLQEAVMHFPDMPGPVLAPHPELSNLSLAFARGDRLTKTVYKHHLPPEARGVFANKKSAFDAAVSQCERVNSMANAHTVCAVKARNQRDASADIADAGHMQQSRHQPRAELTVLDAGRANGSAASSRLSTSTSASCASREAGGKLRSSSGGGGGGLAVWHLKQGRTLASCPDLRQQIPSNSKCHNDAAAAATVCNGAGKLQAATLSWRLPDITPPSGRT